MKKILLIVRARGSKRRAVEDFAREIQSKLQGDTVIELCDISELFFELSDDRLSIYHPQKKFDVRDFDLVIIRNVGVYVYEAHAISQYCDYFNITYTDTYLNRLLLDSKLSTQFLLWCSGIKNWPHTMYGPVDEMVKRFEEFNGRAVLKANDGSRGHFNYVVQTAKDLRAIIDRNPDKHFLLQEFIPNDSDLRVLVLNSKPAMAIRRTGDGSSHLNNTSQGGGAELIPINQIDSQVLSVCVKASDATKLQVAGVDVVYNLDTGKFLLLEINNAPQVSSGVFIDEKVDVYIDMIRDLLDYGVRYDR
ncbi:hypothetical protein GX865_02975 [Candidatus Saccharibacteria bacterium]|jgi:glutathione synthase/RimK-type ligase-like ATP-grasp enzyme|nr:hypothetical protein [Candidatus Saccharibacteria bacterium]